MNDILAYAYHFFRVLSEGRQQAIVPRIGSKLTNRIIMIIPKLSAIDPKATEPTAPIPKANPTVKPAMVPTLPGNNSCAKITVTEKLVIIMNPINNNRKKAIIGDKNGIRMVNGVLKIKENRMTFFRPKRSANGPPKNVPSAPTAKKANR